MPCFTNCKLEITETEKPSLFNINYKNLHTKGNYKNVLDFCREYEQDNCPKEKKVAGEAPTDTQEKIAALLDSMKDLLLYKNQKYGDSALKPKKIFYKGDSTNSILIRLDDKLSRILNSEEEKPRINDCCDLIGYLTLLLISLDVSKEDIEKLKD
jgi:hypothetical protein